MMMHIDTTRTSVRWNQDIKIIWTQIGSIMLLVSINADQFSVQAQEPLKTLLKKPKKNEYFIFIWLFPIT